MRLYPLILPLGERGGVQERRITLDDTVVAMNDFTGPGTREEGTSNNHKNELVTEFPTV